MMNRYTSMLLMIGTGHVFRIAESVSFIVRNSWPDAVLVELDEKRYMALTCDKKLESQEKPDTSNLPRSYARSAKYQEKVSSDNDTQTGGELLAAIQTGKLIHADIVCIDTDAEQVMREMEEEMSFFERTRYSWSILTDRVFSGRKISKIQKEFGANERVYIANMRRKYPTFVRKLIDERNGFMAGKIRENSQKYKNMVIVVGDAHVEGLCELLPDLDIKKIRLADLLDENKLRAVKNTVWNDEWEKKAEE